MKLKLLNRRKYFETEWNLYAMRRGFLFGYDNDSENIFIELRPAEDLGGLRIGPHYAVSYTYDAEGENEIESFFLVPVENVVEQLGYDVAPKPDLIKGPFGKVRERTELMNEDPEEIAMNIISDSEAISVVAQLVEGYCLNDFYFYIQDQRYLIDAEYHDIYEVEYKKNVS